MEGSYSVEGGQGYWLNLRSRGRALLMLFMFSDIGPDDAPTRVKVGSHLDVPLFLVAAGDRGMSFPAACAAMDAAGKLDSPDRKREPRFMAQPPLPRLK